MQLLGLLLTGPPTPARARRERRVEPADQPWSSVFMASRC